MARILTVEDVVRALPPNAPMSMSAAASAFGWNRRRRSCGDTGSNFDGRRGRKQRRSPKPETLLDP
jgi:hypothetical protein